MQMMIRADPVLQHVLTAAAVMKRPRIEVHACHQQASTPHAVLVKACETNGYVAVIIILRHL